MTVAAGTKLGPYEIIAILGSGGMGEVYRARDTRLGRDVAVKVLLPGATESAERTARFEREARAASALNHPNIVTTHDIGEHEKIVYIAMDDPFLVSSLEPVANLSRNVEHLVERQRGFRESLSQRLAVDVFKDEVVRALNLLHAVNARDVRVIQ